MGIGIHDGECREENRETLCSRKHRHLGQRIALLVDSGCTSGLSTALVIETGNSVKRGKDGDLVPLVLAMHVEHKGIHAVVLASIQVLGPAQCALREPWLLPVLADGLDLFDHHIGEPVQGTVFGRTLERSIRCQLAIRAFLLSRNIAHNGKILAMSIFL